jgi:CRISPR-associated protein Csd1
LPPISHTTQQAQVEIVLDCNGNFRRARVVEKAESATLIPCSERSGGRSGRKPVSHPLCDKLQYIAADFSRFGGEVTSGFTKNPQKPHREYMDALVDWTQSNHSHPKLHAIVIYLQKGRVVADLAREGVLPVDDSDSGQPRLVKSWTGQQNQTPAIFKVLPNKQTPADAFVRWRVEEFSNPASATWDDEALIDSWIRYYEGQQSRRGLCMVSGSDEVLAEQHPAKLRSGADKAKLVSSNDTSGYTFRSRFSDADQAAGIGYEVTQKAHNALQWLIKRQGYRNEAQVVVAWAVAGKKIPDPLKNSLELLGVESSGDDGEHLSVGDVGQAFADRLNRAIRGYRAALGSLDDIVIMGLDSANPGRMAITFYRELKGSEFLDRVQEWHQQNAWPQNFGKDLHFVGAPAPREIAEAAYGKRLDDQLRKATVERLLPCIVDARPVPFDLVASAARRASNRVVLPHWEWEKCLGIACSLIKGHYVNRSYQMSLEPKRSTRDYLYGRLLAIAEEIESRALYVAKEKRDTTAARLMQRFAERPCSTWRSIELALSPYKTRLRTSRGPFLYRMETRLDEITAAFAVNEFTDDRPLSGEFLLGYHCERSHLRTSTQADKDEQDSDE